MAAIDILPPPNLCGAPKRFDRWRHLQADAVLAAMHSTKRFIIPGAPTGFGKSLVGVSIGLLTDARTAILTSTKALQSQYSDEFTESGMIEIKGLNAYECVEGGPTGKFGDMRREGYRADRGLPMACDEAPCQSGAFCHKREGGCLYYDAYRRANLPSSKLIVTNYAYWMSINKFGEGLGKIDLLILDEAHGAIDELGGFIGTELRPGDVEYALPGTRMLAPGADQMDWVGWASHWHSIALVKLDEIKLAIRESERTGNNKTGERLSYAALRRARDLRRLTRKLETIASMKGDWIIDHTEDHRRNPLVKFDPVWPGEYAEDNLFLHIPKIVMISATVRPKTAEMLGVGYADMDFKEYPSTFPVKNRPVIYLPTAHMNRNSAASGMRSISTMCDNITARRLDRKGIIHTVSYKRAMDLYQGSSYKEMMLLHDSTNTQEVIAQFRASKHPLILVSPVLDTGYDFPYEQAEYQIIMKMPFPVTVDKIMKARTERDKGYRDYVTMIQLVQMAGRIVRAEDDQGETFIIDSDFGWWYYGSNGKQGSGLRLAPKWFIESVRFEQMLGPALPKLRRVA